MIVIQHDIDRLNRSLKEYQRRTGKTPEEVLAKQGGKLGFALSRQLRGRAPAKGEIREERLAALAAGEGIKVSPEARQYAESKMKGKATVRRSGKKINVSALAVRREIGIRESARMFLSTSSRFPRFARELRSPVRSLNRYGKTLAQAGIRTTVRGAVASFDWGGLSSLSREAAEGLAKPEQEPAIRKAIQLTTLDIEAYIQKKATQDAIKSFKGLVK